MRVVERRQIVGGTAVTEEFHPGFRNSTASYTVSLLHPKVIRDLRLFEHGLRIIERPYSNFLPLDDNDCIKVGGGLAATQREVARFSRRDAERLPAYYAMLEGVATVIKGLLLETPPNAGGGIGDLLQTIKVGKRFKSLDMPRRRDLLDLFTKSAGDILDQWFESDPIKACFGFDSIVGNLASPYTPGSAYVLLHHVLGEVNGKSGAWGHALGGMGAIADALHKEARIRGVEISTSAAVTEVTLRATKSGHAACGVKLADGSEIRARRVISNLNPKLLFRTLIDPSALPDEFQKRIAAYKCGSGSFRMNVALSELPRFTCQTTPGNVPAPHHSSGIIMAPSLGYMEQAYFDARSLGWSQRPIVEMLIPSTVDDSLAPPGKHVASLFCQHVLPRLPREKSWDDERERVADIVFASVGRYAPNFSASVIGRQIFTPLDLERTFGLVDGDIFHGALTLDQLFSARPLLGYGNYRTPIRGLYQCGSGTHPGGGVTGIPGHNAAREILRDR